MPGTVATYSHDARGRRDLATSTQEIVDYIFDDSDRLTGYTKDAGKDGSIDTSAAYAYDANGQRTSSVVRTGSVTTTTTWAYEGLTLLSQRSVTGSVTTGASYINDAAGRAIAAFVSVPGVPEQLVWIVSNARGDVLELLDADGNALSYRHYAPYGELTNTDSQAAGSLSATQTAAIRDTVKLRYAGYVYDDESGLYYCSARYYDPITCQFISKDPARADGEESAYQYCGGDPVGKVDSTGLFPHNFVPDAWKDQTAYFLRVLRVNAGRAYRMRRVLPPAVFGAWWINAVREKGAWDFKRCADKSRRSRKDFRFLGRKISMEQFGNIHYGYVGRAARIPLAALSAASAGVDFASNRRSFSVNEAHDQVDIAVGFALFRVFGKKVRPPWRIDRYRYPGYPTARYGV